LVEPTVALFLRVCDFNLYRKIARKTMSTDN
jgi:hypothetical protein